MGGWRYLDYQQGKAKERLRKSEASLQDFKDLKRKRQIRREDKEGMERAMDRVGDRRDAAKAEVQRLAEVSEAQARRKLLGE